MCCQNMSCKNMSCQNMSCQNDMDEHAKKLITASIVMRSIFSENENVLLPPENIIPWNTIETEIFPTLELMKVKLRYEDFKGSDVVKMIIKARRHEPIQINDDIPFVADVHI